MSQHKEGIVIREGVSIAVMIILYGVPMVLLILAVILIGLGIRYGIRKYRENRGQLIEQSDPEVTDSVQAATKTE